MVLGIDSKMRVLELDKRPMKASQLVVGRGWGVLGMLRSAMTAACAGDGCGWDI